MRIGLYFGSFNPIHQGHLIIASTIVEAGHVQQVWFIVSPQNPLKKAGSLLNEYHRLHLVNLAIEGDNRLRASDIEFKLPRPSYTIDTLVYLHEKYPQHLFSVIMGSDSYQNIDKWKNAELIKKDYNLLIYRRPGFTVESNQENVQLLDAPLLDISATYIRSAIAAKRSVRYLLPDKVLNEIEINRYYH
ncbi:nicotinate-nucleotide adenylyltransferase [Segetibacter sp. 3557_3]|uniref:nicotinate (nicotinamide) nucleotide adenylyltransferase n=1 Tax=Segetibacter sp. 3557_3 TaxID=2547429 RepID=UPI0010587001|nr:nicotinate (nicotinamide) nucleotide adenylyltransferase [Segetibacter sp. 3557_3]TDH25196.1 nicotinate-nucleotide adenylyltransferase [Segetibacter sp. 3557_3]